VLLPVVLLLAATDVGLEGVGWAWVNHRFGIRAFDLGGACAYLTTRAGMLLPAQLGRLLRPDAMFRLGRAPLADCLKAEAVAFVLDATSVVALLAGLICFRLLPLATPLAVIAVVVTALFLGNRAAAILADTRLELPRGFWWRWETVAVVLIEGTGWAAHGVALYVVIRGLPGSFGLWDAVVSAPASAVLGVASGLPGGIGATEGVLGTALTLAHTPTEHLAIAVGAFRAITFWLWIPIGWLALVLIRRHVAAQETRAADSLSPATGDEIEALTGQESTGS